MPYETRSSTTNSGSDVTLQTIVAEVSVNWTGDDPPGTKSVSQLFQAVIEANRCRGYILRDWQLQQTASEVSVGDRRVDRVLETIVAVFELDPAKVTPAPEYWFPPKGYRPRFSLRAWPDRHLFAGLPTRVMTACWSRGVPSLDVIISLIDCRRLDVLPGVGTVTSIEAEKWLTARRASEVSQ